MIKLKAIFKEGGSRNIGYAKFIFSLQTLISDIAPNAWEDKSQIDSTSMKRIHNSLKKRYGSDYKKYNALLKTQKGQFGNWYLKEGHRTSGPLMVQEELRQDELEKFATDLAYSMPNHTKYDDKKGPSDGQIMKAMKKYQKDLYQYSTKKQKEEVIKIVNKTLADFNLKEGVIREGKWMDLWDESQEKAPSAWTKHQKWIVANAERYGFDPTKVKKLLKQHTAIHNRTYGMFASVEDWMEEKLK